MLTACPLRADNLEFVVIGDTRPRFESQDFRLFEGLISKINAAKPALVINLGDLIYGYGPRSKEKQWDKYQQVIKAIVPPYYQLPGNHDTHSKEARKIYGRRFGKFYQSFDYQDWHFVLLDNSEKERWGYLGPAQLEWLKTDLKETRAKGVFVFLHFPVWEPGRITPEYFAFWEQTLHPLFKNSRVRAVFAGHYHAYGPTREFDGIRYFITGGGGAELRPEYKKSGGEHHFVKVKVSGGSFDTRVVTEHGELTDPEADVMGGLQFAARNVSRIGIERGSRDLMNGVSFSVSIDNPYQETLIGQASWLMDASAFSVEPKSVVLEIPPGSKQQHSFTLKALKGNAILPSLPRLVFNVAAGGHRHRFHREVRLVEKIGTPYRRTAPILDGQLADWEGIPSVKLGQDPKRAAEIRTRYDGATLYLAVTIPTVMAEEDEELGFKDDLQIGVAHRLSDTDFGSDFLRLGFSCATQEVQNRTAGRKKAGAVAGIKCVCRVKGGRASYEIAVPLRLAKGVKPGAQGSLILDLAFQVPDGGLDMPEPLDPSANSFAYRIRYGSDSLIPVHFIELTLERKRP
ncbi:MAG: metallophosphoesterase [Verrucomicrobia bacterium]|nr:metallophosphoesterase [Verrucomicrobiota bacterium]